MSFLLFSVGGGVGKVAIMTDKTFLFKKSPCIVFIFQMKGFVSFVKMDWCLNGLINASLYLLIMNHFLLWKNLSWILLPFLTFAFNNIVVCSCLCIVGTSVNGKSCVFVFLLIAACVFVEILCLRVRPHPAIKLENFQNIKITKFFHKKGASV